MIFQLYGRAFNALMKQPIRLIGLSLFGTLLTVLANVLFGIPIGLGMAIGLLFTAAMAQIFLRSYRGEQCETKDFFATFQGKDIIKRTLGGMAWRELWLFIWCLIPIAGPIFVIIKSYQYALTPYILMNEEKVKPMDAIKASKERTQGYRGKMFWADVLVFLLFSVVMLVLGLLSRIPYVGILFTIIMVLAYIVFLALVPLFLGLVRAAFYEEINNPTIPLQKTVPQQPAYPQQPYPQQPYQQPAYPQQPYTQPQQPAYQQPAPQYQQPVYAPPAPTAAPAYRFCTNCGTRYDLNQTQVCPSCGKPAE